MALIKGEYQATLDEKGRVSIPARFREGVPHNVLVLTKSMSMVEACIWAFTPENHEKVTESLRNFWSANANMPMSFEQKVMFDHRVGFSIRAEEIDKTGRIMIPLKFRDYAGLTKDCVVTSDGICIKIWDAGRHAEYERKIEEQFGAFLDKMGPVNLY